MTALVFFHGFTGAPESGAALRPYLANDVGVLAPALLGHSEGPQQGSSFGVEVQRLAETVLQCAEPPVLAGYSLGARLALGIAALHPKRVRALVVIGLNPGLTAEHERTERLHADELLAQFLDRNGTAAFIEQRWAHQPLFASQARLPPAVLAEQQAIRLQHSPKGLATCLRTLGLGKMPSYWETLPRLAALLPITLMTGSLDPKFEALAHRASSLHSTMQWLSIPNAGHNLLLEAPEAVAHAITQYF